MRRCSLPLFLPYIHFIVISYIQFYLTSSSFSPHLQTKTEQRVATLWTKIWPGIEANLGDSTAANNDAKDGSISYKTLVNSLSKNGGIGQEMADNPQMLSDEVAISAVVKATEEAAPSTPPSSYNMELQWGIHHGKLNPLPSDWEFPSHVNILDILHLWFLGEPDAKIPPLKYLHSSYVKFCKSGTGYLSKLRCVMKVISHFGTQLDCWYDEDSLWDDENIETLWQTVWDEIVERLKFTKNSTQGRTVSWQGVYNRMHESGLIKDVNADQEENKDGGEQDLEESTEV